MKYHDHGYQIPLKTSSRIDLFFNWYLFDFWCIFKFVSAKNEGCFRLLCVFFYLLVTDFFYFLNLTYLTHSLNSFFKVSISLDGGVVLTLFQIDLSGL